MLTTQLSHRTICLKLIAMATPATSTFSAKSILPLTNLGELPADLTSEMESILGAAGNESPGMPFSLAIKTAYNRARGGAALLNRATGGRASGQLLSHAADRILSVVVEAAARRT